MVSWTEKTLLTLYLSSLIHPLKTNLRYYYPTIAIATVSVAIAMTDFL
jgi:hypothetical protein